MVRAIRSPSGAVSAVGVVPGLISVIGADSFRLNPPPRVGLTSRRRFWLREAPGPIAALGRAVLGARKLAYSPEAGKACSAAAGRFAAGAVASGSGAAGSGFPARETRARRSPSIRAGRGLPDGAAAGIPTEVEVEVGAAAVGVAGAGSGRSAERSVARVVITVAGVATGTGGGAGSSPPRVSSATT